MTDFQPGDLVQVDGRQSRILVLLDSIAVVSVGDPDRGHVAKCDVIAVPLSAVKPAAVAQ